jgi:thymidylate synthase
MTDVYGTDLAPRIEIIDNRQGYIDIVEHVAKYGVEQPSQYGDTLEIRDAVIVHHAPRDSWPFGIGRSFSPALAAAETLQIVGGFMDEEVITTLVPFMSRFTETVDKRFWGAYGRRSADQMPDVVRKLQEDPDTRQAVVAIWDPVLDSTGGKKDHPCTLHLQFAIRNGKLHMTTSMRSNDLAKGWAHDAPVFTGLQQTVARVLGLPVGVYVHKVFSLHIYRDDIEALLEMGIQDPDAMPYMPSGVGREGETWKQTRLRAYHAYYGENPTDWDESEQFYSEKISAKLRKAGEKTDDD